MSVCDARTRHQDLFRHQVRSHLDKWCLRNHTNEKTDDRYSTRATASVKCDMDLYEAQKNCENGSPILACSAVIDDHEGFTVLASFD